MSIDSSLRKQMVILASSKKTRFNDWTRELPTDWRPKSVRNPHGVIDKYFTNSTAWEFIVKLLNHGHQVDEIILDKPQGKKGYVMIVDWESGKHQIYIKFMLRNGKIIGRSFHESYSNK